MKKPWFHKQRGIWYLEHPSGRINLGKDKVAAYDTWHQLLAGDTDTAIVSPTFSEVYRNYVAAAVAELKAGRIKNTTLTDYCRYVDKFCELHGQMQINQLKHFHVTTWLTSNPQWTSSGQRAAIKSVNRILNWATKQGYTQNNPLAGFAKPPKTRHETLIDADTHQRLVREARNSTRVRKQDRQFGLVLVALKHCGGRPQDISNVRVEHIDRDFNRWIIPEHKRLRSTRKPRVVYLSPCLRTITRILAWQRTAGPLFRGRCGKLSVNAIGHRLNRIKSRLSGIDTNVIAYSYRHTYITNSLLRGVDVAAVAELAGTSIRMIEDHYGHLAAHNTYLSSMAAQATTATPH